MKQLKTGFLFQEAFCRECRFELHKKMYHRRYSNLVLYEPQELKENIINFVRGVHNKNCENGLVIVIDNCHYE